MTGKQLKVSQGAFLIDYDGPERRGTPRIDKAFPVKVSGTDVNRQAIEADVLLENLSSSGLYLYLPQKVERGASLSVIIRLPSVLTGKELGARVAAHGDVVRVELRADGYYGLAVAFKHHCFL